jgi:APA family basic amino acid/polyamine antiporter
LNLPAMFIVAVMGCLIGIGIKQAASFNTLMVIIKVGVILLFIACGVAFINKANWTPFIPENTGIFGQYGWSGIFRASGIMFFAFTGFDALSTVAQEAKNPQKDMPIGMLGSLGVSTICYILVVLVLTGVVSYTMLNVPDPIAVAVNAMGPSFIWLRFVIKIAILAGMTSVILVMLLGQTRIFYTMSHDGLLPKKFGKVSDKYHTPLFNTVIVTFAGMLLSGFLPVSILGQLTVMGALLAFALVCFAVLVLRFRQPLLHRPFKTPLFPWIPILGTLSCIVQMILLPSVVWMQLIGWLIIGYFIYFYYGQHHSKLRNPVPKKK